MMTRSIWTLALLFLMSIAVPAPAGAAGPNDPHIRSTIPELLEAIAAGSAASPTLKRLVDRLDRSDVIVYVIFDRSPAPRTAGHISLLASAGGRRYLRIAIDRRYAGWQRISILGHELQHAVEIADDASAVDQASMAALYRRIGFHSDDLGAECFDSLLAIETGRQVQREALARGFVFGTH